MAELYPIIGLQLAARMPGRSAEAIKLRARHLGVAMRGRRRWTMADDAQLRSLYGTTTAADIAAVLGRTENAVVERARILGIAMERRPWTPADDCTLRALYAISTAAAIAPGLGRTEAAVTARAAKIGARKYRRRAGG